MNQSVVISVSIARSAEEVYRYASNPANLPRWVGSFFRSVAERDGKWIAETVLGSAEISFADANPFGVLDHVIRTEDGAEFRNPMRVIPNGEGSELQFTLFKLPAVSDEQFADDQAMVRRDLDGLKALLER